MIYKLQLSTKKKQRKILENDMSFNSGVEQETTNIFQKLLNQARSELYPDCLEFSSLNFLVTLMQVKVLNGWSNKFFEMLLELLKCVFLMCSTVISSSFYEVKWKLHIGNCWGILDVYFHGVGDNGNYCLN